MGESRSPAELGSKILGAAGAVGAATRVAVEQASLAAKETFNAAAVARGIPTEGFKARGVGKPRRWGTRYNVKGNLNATGLVRMWGSPPAITERGSYKKPSGWAITRKKGNAKVRRAAKVAQALGALAGSTDAIGIDAGQAKGFLTTPYHPVKVVHHPPLARKPFIAAAKAQVVKQTPVIAKATYRRALISKF